MNRHTTIERLQSMSGQVEAHYDDVQEEYDYFIHQNYKLQATSNPANIRVSQYKPCLNNIKKKLASLSVDITTVQLNITEEISEHECTIHQDEKRLNMSLLMYQQCIQMIEMSEARIEECKEDEQLASVNAKYNRKISKGAKRRAILGGVISFASGIGGFIVGAVLAPFTLGGSVAVSAAYGVAAGVNISAAVINGVNASECTDRADLHESTAKELRDDIQRLEEECEKEEKEMERLMSAIDSLTRSNEELKFVRDVAFNMLKFIYESSERLQEADGVLFEVIQETDAFELVPILLASNPGCALAHIHLHELQQKWEDVNNLLRRNLRY
ncbi:uncharacterized protein LOC128240748 [Mya arenaria]|uniref:uncharacterized protein LOC128240748 n=1 Tax=Mya arenaria TaxID=6604 RepID=UPI0022E0D860|nr:uncharacterized protein LOC128240748 [Mya arenaria]